MKKPIILLTFFLNCLLGTAQENSDIVQIRENFQAWQPIIESKLKTSTQFFHYAWGENYQEDEWYTSEQASEDKFLFQKTYIIEKANLGTFVYYDNFAMSGDWKISVDYYFDTNDRLYFIFWRMNTFQANEPLTIEKRLYFNSEGELIRNLKSTFKMNTKDESTAGFADRDVEYELHLNKMDFYSKWKEE
ncbi:MAG: hypothetical protein R8N23_07770 [Reichenbachiella sp.]|uniref:hypothetical protein n=1 Tax=Reichenbachiella sp. TaxID=2184521 RepID=UPI00296634E5|nr:hypothetical protein [Reichenbachiella sp.]MDW3209748.1 hypothetical protein [Reichenbachiella sp.]